MAIPAYLQAARNGQKGDGRKRGARAAFFPPLRDLNSVCIHSATMHHPNQYQS
jgi:hypothetical protein